MPGYLLSCNVLQLRLMFVVKER